jgi:transcriptional regulator
MYIPNVFAEHDEAEIRALVEAHSFGTLLVPQPGGQIEISHVPFVLGADGTMLRAHVARANPIWRLAISPQRSADVVVVFHGPHGYVSPTWYEKPRVQVPTWNYAMVHAHVSAPEVMPENELRALLGDLTKTYEKPGGWSLADLEPEAAERMLKEIVGLFLPVARWEAKLKLSQNRSAFDHASVREAFKTRGTPDDYEMARLMNTRRPKESK